MFIENYDMYKKDSNKYLLYNTTKSDLYYLTIFLIWFFDYIRRDGTVNFIEKLKTVYKDGMSFELVNIDIDNENNLVYFSESYHTYDKKSKTHEIDDLLKDDNIIQLCKIGFLNHIVMSKENFIHILLGWDRILNSLPLFVLVYKDDKDWYDVLPFDSQQKMEQFIVDNTK